MADKIPKFDKLAEPTNSIKLINGTNAVKYKLINKTYGTMSVRYFVAGGVNFKGKVKEEEEALILLEKLLLSS